jgi:hypothetical protein
MNLRSHPHLLISALVFAALGTACEAEDYPNCGAFEFGDLEQAPRLIDGDATPDDCGRVRVEGNMEAPTVPDATALDCALEHLADGRAMQLEVNWGPDAEYSEDASLWSDEDGVAMRWRRITNDLNLEREARVYQLDAGRIAGCQDLADAGERFTCLYDAFDAGEVVKTCKTASRTSE